MNVAQLKDRIFKGTQHKFTDQFHMLDLLNDALTDMTNDAKLEGMVPINVINGTASYALPNDFKSPKALIDGTIDNPDFVYDLVSIDSFDSGYTIWNGELTLRPTPTKDKTLHLYYFRWPRELVKDEDIPEIDEHYHNTLADGAIATILAELNASQAMIDMYVTKWNNGLTDFRRDIAKKNRQDARVKKVKYWI